MDGTSCPISNTEAGSSRLTMRRNGSTNNAPTNNSVDN